MHTSVWFLLVTVWTLLIVLAVLTELWGEWIVFLLFFDGLGEGKGA